MTVFRKWNHNSPYNPLLSSQFSSLLFPFKSPTWSTYTTIWKLGPIIPSMVWYFGASFPNSCIYGPLGTKLGTWEEEAPSGKGGSSLVVSSLQEVGMEPDSRNFRAFEGLGFGALEGFSLGFS